MNIQTIVLKVKSAKLLLTNGADVISLELDLPSTHPNMGFAASLDIKCQYNFGLEWSRTNLKIEPEIVNVSGSDRQIIPLYSETKE